MDTRVSITTASITTAALAVLLLPLGYQLFSSTALTPPTPSVVTSPQKTAVTPPPPEAKPQNLKKAQAPAEVAVAPLAVAPARPEPSPTPISEPLSADKAAARVAADQRAQTETTAPQSTALGNTAPLAAKDEGRVDQAQAQPVQSAAATGGLVTDSLRAPAAPTSSLGATTPTGDSFAKFTESAEKNVVTDPVSTFSIDVDTASYSYMRRSLQDGRIPEPDAVRIEELLNYFPYDYPAAASRSEPFKPTMAVYPTPWNPKTELLQIGIKGFVPPASERKPSNLVFLVDTSGSMDEPDKLPLLKRALTLLVDTLSADDTVAIVAYAGSAGTVLEPTKGNEKSRIVAALDNLEAGGSTAGAEGIALAYQLANEHKLDNGTNRVILATDGDFNVGISDPDELKTFIKGKRDSGISLSVLGFGQGNLDDATMQALAQNGNGNASYIDSFAEAQKVLVKEAGATLDTIANDVKIQIEFNPAMVAEYRLIGYETRALNREDFNNDKVDAGDVGEGHTVTALYEITPAGAAGALIDPLRYGKEVTTPSVATATAPSGEIAYLKLRYKLPGGTTSKLLQTPVTQALAVDDIAKASDDQRWAAAVAAFGQKLKGSNYAGALSYDAIRALAQGARGKDEDGYRAEFIRLIDLAKTISGPEGKLQ